MADATTTAKRRGTTLSPAELFVLDQWGRQLREAFGETPYLVGSAERGGDWRDVDVRMLLPWAEEVISPIGVYTLNVALSLWGRHVTGLPIDFQMQGEQAFHGYDGETRNPLGTRARTGYRGVTEVALGLPSRPGPGLGTPAPTADSTVPDPLAPDATATDAFRQPASSGPKGWSLTAAVSAADGRLDATAVALFRQAGAPAERSDS